HGEVGFLEKVGAVRLPEPFDRDLKDLEAHLGEVVERLIAVDALFHVDLTDGTETCALQRVHEKPRLDAVPREKRQLLQQRSPPGLLARKRLDAPREVRKATVQEPPRPESRHAPRTRRLQISTESR